MLQSIEDKHKEEERLRSVSFLNDNIKRRLDELNFVKDGCLRERKTICISRQKAPLSPSAGQQGTAKPS